MKVSRNWLQTYFDKDIPSADELAELFTFHAFEVEGIEKLDENEILDVKVLPDRAHYALCHNGIAREVSVITGQPFKANRIPPGPQATLETRPQVRIDAPEFCRRYMARYAEIPRVKESNPHAVTMLEGLGQRAINAVVDATNVNMLDNGQPLHIFDADKVKGTLVIRAAKKGEKIAVLDSSAGTDREVDLLETDYIIADDEGPLVIAGVKGGKRAAVTDATRRLIIESANFEPSAVRRTSTRLNLRSESSKRFENEITAELAAAGMDNTCALIQYNIPETKFGPIIDEYPVKALQTVMEFDPAYIEERLGVKVSLDNAKDILVRMNIGVAEASTVGAAGPLWKLAIPYERLDLVIREDIVEEIGRIYGYDHVQGILPPPPAAPVSVLMPFYLTEKIRTILADKGFSEISLSTLVSKGEVETAYPMARDKAFVRSNLSEGVMNAIEKNALNADLLGLYSIKVFEIGRVFSTGHESLRLSLGAVQIKKVKGLKSETFLAEAVQAIEEALAIKTPTPVIITKGAFAVCEINLDPVLHSYVLPQGASYAELNFGPGSPNRYKKFSQYPFMVRDIAVFVPNDTIESTDVWNFIEKGIEAVGVQDLLARHSLFDTFKKDGKVSYAFRMVFQAPDRTLTDAETNAVMDRIYAEMKEQGWEVR
ncbi:MAG: phenylalanyl-tRNA synthetase subunit beta, phenylalanyl-tRNA synthetase beta chain [Candidatus Parcubacteria bacterium]|nr:phenylalanyl-tRNA synthetase subunit beta, phenylalanyl-tRNA synthetase beta chain [Candidatus Parcubacteria bacterium]